MRDLLRIALDPLSLDSPVGEEDESNLGDFIERRQRRHARRRRHQRRMLHEAVEQPCSASCPTREQEIVRMRFGLDGAQAKTLEEVGRSSGSPASGSVRSRPRHSPSCGIPSDHRSCGSSSNPSSRVGSSADEPILEELIRAEDTVARPARSGIVSFRHSGIAQLAERLTVNQHVAGSSPAPGATQQGPRCGTLLVFSGR